MTSRGWWKKREAIAAAKFGARRQPGSGSMNRPERSRSDSDHPTIFLEVKVRESHAVRGLWEKTKKLAQKERKTPCLVIYDKARRGGLIVVHEDDAQEILAAIVAAQQNPDDDPTTDSAKEPIDFKD